MKFTRAKGAIKLLQNVCSGNEPERTLGFPPNTLALLLVGAFYDETSETRLSCQSALQESIPTSRTDVNGEIRQDLSIIGGV